MIKNLRMLRLAKNKAEFQQLKEFFSQLGLRDGEHWEARSNSGHVFLVEDGGIELGVGEGFPEADLVFEVNDADGVYELLKKKGWKKLGKPEDQPFGARLFTAEVGGQNVAFYNYLPENQHHVAKEREATLNARGKRFALVVSRFNSFITERLLDGALLALRHAGVEKQDMQVVRVPGAFEIPGAARALAESGKFDGIITLGCLLRGGTLHYEVIANEVTRGVGQSAQETGVPHGFGVLTCDTLEQAIDRAGLKAGNKGYEAAMAAIEMVNLKLSAERKLSKPEPKAKAKDLMKTRALTPVRAVKRQGEK
ncbi:Riboflavin synthase [Candidatus Koribacter versatilis Ellin345]|uniref:6,7-dimethyl-8-ribityllumazine synthase n=1 Tax=Koribacter versatilis (strain Ellin345) TaxID=204669 RepID=Q1ISD4_KORVE|nr:6,7-dimethyl-8-ribityllumazine synthase [Candidatus Koribacter versatilis]ABF40216.1 Riboflavin synthase [Candidatus Koribacter versatilis Ellin345]